MSTRPRNVGNAPCQLRRDLEELQNNCRVTATQEAEEKEIVILPELAGLASHERTAAKLGVGSEDLKPIGFLNSGHYDSLNKGNLLSPQLAQQLEAFKMVSSS